MICGILIGSLTDIFLYGRKIHAQVWSAYLQLQIYHAHDCFRKATKQMVIKTIKKIKPDFDDLNHKCFVVYLFDMDVKA